MAPLGSTVKICYRLTTRGAALRVLEAAKAVGERENNVDVAIMGLGEGGDWARIKELQTQVDDLKELVNTLLSVIVEEPDGVHTGSAPTGGHPLANTCM